MNLLKKWSLRVLLFVVFIVALVAATYNSQDVALSFLGWKTPEFPLSAWVLTAFVLGVLFGMAINFFTNAKLRMTARKANRAVEKATRDLDKARAKQERPPDAPASSS